MRTKLHYFTCDGCEAQSDMYEFADDLRSEARRLGWTRVPRQRQATVSGTVAWADVRPRDLCPSCTAAANESPKEA